MEKECKNCEHVENMTGADNIFRGYCKLHGSYIKWTYCSQFSNHRTTAKGQNAKDSASAV